MPLRTLKMFNAPHEILVLNAGADTFGSFIPDMRIGENANVSATVTAIFDLLRKEAGIPDYCL